MSTLSAAAVRKQKNKNKKTLNSLPVRPPFVDLQLDLSLWSVSRQHMRGGLCVTLQSATRWQARPLLPLLQVCDKIKLGIKGKLCPKNGHRGCFQAPSLHTDTLPDASRAATDSGVSTLFIDHFDFLLRCSMRSQLVCRPEPTK